MVLDRKSKGVRTGFRSHGASQEEENAAGQRAAYDLRSVRLPVLEGPLLRAFAGALETKLGGALLLGNLLKSGGLARLRSLHPVDAPLYVPTRTVAPLDESTPPMSSPPHVAESDALFQWRATPQCNQPSSRQFESVAHYASAYRSGQATPIAVAERLIEALDADHNAPRPINAFVALNRDDLLLQARASAERFRAGEPLGPLDGVPVAIKDEVDMVPYPTTVGTRFLGAAPASQDATAVARLRAAGALLVGKAHMHEIGINPTGHNIHFGHCRNPHNPEHDTGGSSSGSAAAVAAGYCPVALGADGGGSIRIPAAHCGVVGLKPTFGRISEAGAAPLCWSVAHLGPLGATVADVAIAYAIMAGPDPNDPHSLHQPAPTLTNLEACDLTGVRVGVFEPWNQHAAEPIVKAIDEAKRALQQAGAEIVLIAIPNLDALRIAHAVTILSEMATALQSHAANYRQLAPATRINLRLGRSFTASDYVKAQRIRAQGMHQFGAIFKQVDAILSPSSAVTAPAIPPNGIPHGLSDLSTVTEIMRYAIPGNLLGFPALSVPVGTDPQGLPIGAQLMARHWEEALILRLGLVIEMTIPPPMAPRRTSLLK